MASPQAAQIDARRDPALPLVAAAAAGLVAAAIVAGAAALYGPVVLAGVVALAVAGWCAWRPHWAVYIYLALLPFIAGFPRGAAVLRPNEVVLGLVLAGAVAGLLIRYAAGRSVRPPLVPRLDLPLAVFVLLATVWPLTSVMLGGRVPSLGEALAIGPAIKLSVLLLLVRVTVTTVERVVVCLRLIVWTAAGVAAIAIAQTLKVAAVVDLLLRVDPALSREELTDRGTTTLASSIATGDYVAIGLIVLVAAGVYGVIGRGELVTGGAVLATGAFAAGQFSTWIVVGVAALVVIYRLPEVRLWLLRTVPVLVLALLVGGPTLLDRLSGFTSEYGVPRSWLGRWDNLSNFYFDPLFRQGGFIGGVSPNSVLPAPETWREVIFLESGYLDLLWIGGIPLLGAFLWLSVAVLRAAAPIATVRDPWGVAAFSLGVAWVMVLAISLIDPHLFLRGTGDLLFILLGIVGVGVAERRGVP